MNTEFTSYLQGQIIGYEGLHTEYLEEADVATTQLGRACNQSKAAHAWEQKCLVEEILAKYESLASVDNVPEWPVGVPAYEVEHVDTIEEEPAKQPETILEWLQTFPEPYRSQAIENYEKETDPHFLKWRKYKRQGAYDALNCAFRWNKSNGGLVYWKIFADTLQS